jgi:cytochrome c556
MRIVTRATGLAAVAAVIGTMAFSGFGARAQDATPSAASDIILTRQAGYDLLNATAGLLKRAVDSKQDPKIYVDATASMVKWGQQIPTAFPPGSDTGHPTHALPAVWSDRAGFEKAAANFVAAATKLNDAAKAGDQDAFASAFSATGQACGACHRTYRAKIN